MEENARVDNKANIMINLLGASAFHFQSLVKGHAAQLLHSSLI